MVKKKPLQRQASPVPEDSNQLNAEAAHLVEALRQLMLKLYADHLSDDGKTVDYKAMRNSEAFESYCELAVLLQQVDLKSLTKEEKLAFFINVYNALVIHGQIQMGTPKNVWQRYKVSLSEVQPLIHFALNCGGRGCPPIKTYTPKDIDQQLRAAGEAFLAGKDGCFVNIEKKEIHLNQIFKWYKTDFGDTDEKVVQWVLDHMTESLKKKQMKEVLESSNCKIIFLPYDWSSNSLN
ncbi:uncharacterized protein LOC122802493 isoform X3 [Protopterus annectens]|uniref:uncharacterized protein LOC122802493 isoform X3 n=1 Tax=Protopterus annectens TaxID=7888 RepID=UPI001CF9986F|nr:uncharacterized protein LOC122802493 isoform X3 [Protopterus annectens]